MGAISDRISNPQDKNAAADLEYALGYARWIGSSVCGISRTTAQHLLTILLEKEKKEHDQIFDSLPDSRASVEAL